MEPRHIDVYRRLRDSGRLTMRVKAVPEYQRFTRPSDHQKSMAELAATLDDALAAVDVGDEWVRAEGITVSGGGTCGMGNMPWPTTYRDAFGHATNGRWFISHEAIEQAVEFCAREGLRLNVCAMGPAEHDVLLELVERHGVRDGIVQHGALMPLAHARRWAAAGFRQTICCGFTWGKGDVYRRAFGDESIADLNPLRRLLDEGLVLAASTDWGPKNPWEQMWLAADPSARTLRDPQRRPRSGRHPRRGARDVDQRWGGGPRLARARPAARRQLRRPRRSSTAIRSRASSTICPAWWCCRP